MGGTKILPGIKEGKGSQWNSIYSQFSERGSIVIFMYLAQLIEVYLFLHNVCTRVMLSSLYVFTILFM